MALNYVEDAKGPGIETSIGAMDECKSISSDDAVLLAMGKKPELKRVYNFWTCQ
jgi:choline transport protein